MSIDLPIDCKEEGVFIFTIEDDGTITCDDQEFEAQIALAELGFEPSICVGIFRFFEGKPFYLLMIHVDNLIQPDDLFLFLVEIAEEEDLFEVFYPDVIKDYKIYKDLAAGEPVSLRSLEDERGFGNVSYMHAGVWDRDAGGCYMMGSLQRHSTHALQKLRHMARALHLGLINTQNQVSLPQFDEAARQFLMDLAVAKTDKTVRVGEESFMARDIQKQYELLVGRILKKVERHLVEQGKAEEV